MTDQEYFELFFDEKEIGYESWKIEAPDGVTHFIDSDVVIEAIKRAPAHEQKAIRDTLVKIDFLDGDVMDYLHHLAKGLAANYGGQR